MFDYGDFGIHLTIFGTLTQLRVFERGSTELVLKSARLWGRDGPAPGAIALSNVLAEAR